MRPLAGISNNCTNFFETHRKKRELEQTQTLPHESDAEATAQRSQAPAFAPLEESTGTFVESAPPPTKKVELAGLRQARGPLTRVVFHAQT